VVPQDQVAAGGHQAAGDVLLALGGLVLVLVAPVEAHHHQVGPALRLPDRLEGRLERQGTHPGLRGAVVQIEVEEVRETEEGHLDALAFQDLEPLRLGLILAAADGHQPLGPEALQGLPHPLGSLIEGVVVRGGEHREAAGPQRGGQRLRRIELEGHTRPSGLRGDGRFQVAEGQIRPLEQRDQVAPKRREPAGIQLGGPLHVLVHQNVAHGHQGEAGRCWRRCLGLPRPAAHQAEPEEQSDSEVERAHQAHSSGP